MKDKLQTCEFIAVTDLVPSDWSSWFWTTISEGAPFSWGDNNRSLVTAERFMDHCERALAYIHEDEDLDVTEEEIEKFLEMLDGLVATYIDLEN